MGPFIPFEREYNLDFEAPPDVAILVTFAPVIAKLRELISDRLLVKYSSFCHIGPKKLFPFLRTLLFPKRVSLIK